MDEELEAALMRAGAQMSGLQTEIGRLGAALKKANDQAEHFEREWYLRGDEIERLQHAAAANTMPTAAPGQCPMCGEHSMAARARQGLYGHKVDL